MKHHVFRQCSTPTSEQIYEVFQESLEKQIDYPTGSVSGMGEVLDRHLEGRRLGPVTGTKESGWVTDRPADRPAARREQKADVHPKIAPDDPNNVRRRIQELDCQISKLSLEKKEREEKNSQGNSAINHGSQPPKTADPTAAFLPHASSAGLGDNAKQEWMLRMKSLRIDAHRARFNSHLKAVRGVEHTSHAVVNRELLDEARTENMKNRRINVYRAQFGGHVQAPKLVEQPSLTISRTHVDAQEQARNKANEKSNRCETLAQADVQRDVQRTDRAGELLSPPTGPTVQVHAKGEKADGGAVVDAVLEVPNAKEVDDRVVLNAGAEQLRTEKADVGANLLAAPANGNAERVDDFDDDFSDYNVVESDVRWESSFFPENDWLIVAKEDGYWSIWDCA